MLNAESCEGSGHGQRDSTFLDGGTALYIVPMILHAIL
jgi:hypothetical protein